MPRRDAGREGMSAGWCAWSAGDASLTFSLVVRPDVNMHAFHGLPFVAAMGMMDALVGTASTPAGLAARWAFSGRAILCAVRLRLRRRLHASPSTAVPVPAGMFGAVTVDIERAALGELGVDVTGEALVEALAAAVLARVDAGGCCQHAAGCRRALAPVLGEYFDMVPLLGRQVAAVSPNGLPLAVGVFAGLDIWGRATIKTDAGEQEFPSEAVRIRGL